MNADVSPRAAWVSTVAVLGAACLWLSAGVLMVLLPEDPLVRIAGAAIAAGGVLTLAASVSQLRRGHWTTAAAAQAGAGWPQPVLTSGMFSCLSINFLTDDALDVVSTLGTIACALGLLTYHLRRRSRTTR